MQIIHPSIHNTDRETHGETLIRQTGTHTYINPYSQTYRAWVVVVWVCVWGGGTHTSNMRSDKNQKQCNHAHITHINTARHTYGQTGIHTHKENAYIHTHIHTNQAHKYK